MTDPTTDQPPTPPPLSDDDLAAIERSADDSHDPVMALHARRLVAEVHRQRGELEHRRNLGVALEQTRAELAQVAADREHWSESTRRACERHMAETERLEAAEEQLAGARHAATEAAEVSADAWREVERLRARVAELEQPGRWQLPTKPGPEVTHVWDVEGIRWERQQPGVDRWHCDEHMVFISVRTWGALLSDRGPLSPTPAEGGGQHG
jgi:hypothetical protein